MKLKWIWSILLVAGCSADPAQRENKLIEKEEEQFDFILSDSSHINELFPEYKRRNKDTIQNIWPNGIISQSVVIGNYKMNENTYQSISEFRRIPVIENYRGQSRLFMVSTNQDTLEYYFSMPEDLPIDVYQNHFVFYTKEAGYTFGEIDYLDSQRVCFAGNHNQCSREP